jgi:hypothetical protein
VVREAGERYRLDPDLLNSMIRVGSGFNPHAVSPKGARGLMQLMPRTASKLGVPNAFDPAASVDAGARYLRELLERYKFDLVKALAAYKAGPELVDQYGGVPPYYETRAYVANVVKDFNRKKIAQEKAAIAKSETNSNQHRSMQNSNSAPTPRQDACVVDCVAVTRNGFRIKHQRREIVGNLTRLYVNADGSSFIDVPTAEIEDFKADSSSPSRSATSSSAPASFPATTPTTPSRPVNPAPPPF